MGKARPRGRAGLVIDVPCIIGAIGKRAFANFQAQQKAGVSRPIGKDSAAWVWATAFALPMPDTGRHWQPGGNFGGAISDDHNQTITFASAPNDSK